MKVIISAAGWKGAGAQAGLAGCPEPFLPLGDGTTALSRTATIFADNGCDVYVAIGKRGYQYNKYVRLFATPNPPYIGDDFDWEDSPWTQERYDYAAQFGEVLEMTNPGGWTLSLDTFCEAMDMIGVENWDHLFLAAGDMLLPKHCLEFVFSAKIPFVFSLTAYHAYFGLDAESAKFFRAYTEPFRRFGTRKEWDTDKRMAPSYCGTMALKEAGFNIYGRDAAPEQTWHDVDVCGGYQTALRLVSEGVV